MELFKCRPYHTVLLVLLLCRFCSALNDEYNPCTTPKPLEKGDGLSIAFQLADNVDTWPPQTTPCDPNLLAKLPSTVQYAVFRPKVDEITVLRISNDSLEAVENSFSNSGNLSLIAFSGSSPAYVSAPRQHKSKGGRVPTFTLILYLEKGLLKSFIWKSTGCLTCGNLDSLCFNGDDCATPMDECNATNTTGVVNPCRLAINVAWSGTDKNDVVLKSWFQIDQIGKYSITALYDKAAGGLNEALGTVQDQVTLI